MHPDTLTPIEIADLLDAAYRADRGEDVDAPSQIERTALADYLGCHEDAREAAWAAWQEQLSDAGEDLSTAEYWLDVDFVQPCLDDRPAGA